MDKVTSSWEKAVRHELIDRDMTVDDLARELNVTRAYIYDIFRGGRKATNMRQKINDYLGIEGE